MSLLQSSRKSCLPAIGAAAAGLVLLLSQPGLAKESDDYDFVMNTSSINNAGRDGTVTSEQLLELGTPTPDSLKLTAQECSRKGNLNKAIMNYQRAVEMDPTSVDTRAEYAAALEKKLRGQKDRDPKLFNFVIKQWLFVYRKADFLDEKQLSSDHLVALTGIAPNRHERTKGYLAKVLMPEDGSRQVAFGKRIKSDTQ
jgi:tetratricopeptide (TPR) repeat protein